MIHLNLHNKENRMENMGYIFGISGLSFAIIAWGQIAALRKEFEELKQKLEAKGVIE
jgi:hypothetical protein